MLPLTEVNLCEIDKNSHLPIFQLHSFSKFIPFVCFDFVPILIINSILWIKHFFICLS